MGRIFVLAVVLTSALALQLHARARTSEQQAQEDNRRRKRGKSRYAHGEYTPCSASSSKPKKLFPRTRDSLQHPTIIQRQAKARPSARAQRVFMCSFTGTPNRAGVEERIAKPTRLDEVQRASEEKLKIEALPGSIGGVERVRRTQAVGVPRLDNRAALLAGGAFRSVVVEPSSRHRDVAVTYGPRSVLVKGSC